MRIVERIFIVIAIIGVVFKFLHWPGAGPLIALGLFVLAIVYLTLGWLLFRPKKSKTTIVGLAILAGFGLAISLIGILFKLQHWPGGHIHLATGAFLCLVIIVPLSIMFMQKNHVINEEYSTHQKNNALLDAPEAVIVIEKSKYNYSKNVFKRAAIIGGLAALLYFLPWSVLNKLQYWDDPELVRLMTRADEDPSVENWDAVWEYKDKKYNDQFNPQVDTLQNENH